MYSTGEHWRRPRASPCPRPPTAARHAHGRLRASPSGAPSAPSAKRSRAFAFSKAALYSLAPSELSKRIAKIVSCAQISPPDNQSHALQTHRHDQILRAERRFQFNLRVH